MGQQISFRCSAAPPALSPAYPLLFLSPFVISALIASEHAIASRKKGDRACSSTTQMPCHCQTAGLRVAPTRPLSAHLSLTHTEGSALLQPASCVHHTFLRFFLSFSTFVEQNSKNNTLIEQKHYARRPTANPMCSRICNDMSFGSGRPTAHPDRSRPLATKPE